MTVIGSAKGVVEETETTLSRIKGKAKEESVAEGSSAVSKGASPMGIRSQNCRPPSHWVGSCLWPKIQIMYFQWTSRQYSTSWKRSRLAIHCGAQPPLAMRRNETNKYTCFEI